MIIMFITSNLSSFGKPGDHRIVEWNKSGLPKPSMLRMKFATIEKSIVIKTLGMVLKTDQLEVNNKLAEFFGLDPMDR